MSIGRIVPGERLAESYEQADKALSAGIGDKQAVFEEDLKLAMCIADIAPGTRSEFSRRVLKHVLGREELLDTLRAFFDQAIIVKAHRRRHAYSYQYIALPSFQTGITDKYEA